MWANSTVLAFLYEAEIIVATVRHNICTVQQTVLFEYLQYMLEKNSKICE